MIGQALVGWTSLHRLIFVSIFPRMHWGLLLIAPNPHREYGHRFIAVRSGDFGELRSGRSSLNGTPSPWRS
jgi:hypothetical protein